ncbi:leucine-rich repeat and guanylate kinase domain-containing protein-like [Castor canadensis]|uniref:Leucine-rich repeat and guanylate kinase domain-containing protein-like n=1 Tax=Castor canadensis TaxID=51338 RepID=A0AC58LP14_CASCN
MHRQHETARQALMGKIPPNHTLLFQRGPVPAPKISGLQYFTTAEEPQKSSELCEGHFKPPFGLYPEMSDKASFVSMKFSALLHSCPWSFPLSECSISSWTESGISVSEVDQAIKATLEARMDRNDLYDKGLQLHLRNSRAFQKRPLLQMRIITYNDEAAP